MCVLRRLADIANAAVTRARPPPLSTSAATPAFLSEKELAHLTEAVAHVTPDHLAIHPQHFINRIPPRDDVISYISVADEENFTMAVFVIPPGSEIPLHDHTEMYVITKVLWGTLEVQEYEPLSSDNPFETHHILAQKQPISVLTEGDVCNLTPFRGNIHSFRASDWTAVFDLLVPPYDPYYGRNCNYYTPLQEVSDHPHSAKNDHVILQRSQCPETYQTISVEYNGVPLNSQ